MAGKINGILLIQENPDYFKLFNNKEKLDAYKERIAKDYNNDAKKILSDVFTFEEGIVKGSNSFAAVGLASSRLTTPSQLEPAFRMNPDFFVGVYVDPGFVLRTNGDSYEPNDFLAKHFTEQVKYRTGKMPTPEVPARISLKGLSVEKGNNPYYGGLVFAFGEDTEIIFAREFSHNQPNKKFSVADERGVPIFDINGRRELYTRDAGLSRLCLGRDSVLGSGVVDLSSSNACGRLAVVSAEGAQKILTEYQAKLAHEKNAIAATLEEKSKNYSIGVIKKVLNEKGLTGTVESIIIQGLRNSK